MKRAYIPYIFLIPFFINLAVFSLFTLGFGLYMSFTNWNPWTPIGAARFVGLANYSRALTDDPVFLLAIKNAFIYVLYEPIAIFLGFFFALILNTALKGRSVFRTIFFLPVITSTVAISFVWNWLYDYEYGPFNEVLRALGLLPQHWLSHIEVLPGVPIALLSVMLMSTWQWVGLNVIIFLAALQSIPKEYHEAARVMGANAVNRFRHVTLPLVRPALLFCAITATAGSLQVFTEIYMLAREVPNNLAQVPVLWMTMRAINFGEFGYGAALAYTFFLIILGVSLIEIRILRRGGMFYY
nr:sugar ABC transporter permease [Candidatus Njordarchaeum guaymaensis]